MGHQLARAAAAAALTIVASCGGGGDDAEPSVLDNARAQVATPTDDPDGPAGEPGDGTSPPTAAVEELPPPDPSRFEGANRVVNLWIGPDGETRVFDVWGRRTFTHGPILLADELGYGDVSERFGAPIEYQLAVVAAGAGADGVELAGLINAVDGEDIVSFVVADGSEASVRRIWASDPSGRFGAPEPPADGRGLVVIVAPALGAAGDELMAAFGSRTFAVGDGSGDCRPQRVERDGFQPELLGDGTRVELETRPGSVTISLHPTATPGDCSPPAVIEADVDVDAGDTVLAVIHAPDGATLDVLTLPLG